MTDVNHFEIARLRLHDGDTLVVRTELVLSKEQTAFVEDIFRPHVPDGCKLLVVGGGLQLDVLTRHDDP
jgi:hypothetical protein